MTKIILGILLFSGIACANYPPTTIKGQSDTTPKTKFSFQVPAHQSTDLGGIKALIETGSQNRLANPGQEATTSSWTASAGSLTLESGATNISSGVQSQKWDPAAANDTAASTAFTIPNGLYGKNGELSCWIKTASVLHELQAYDGTNVIASSGVITTASSGVFVSVNFIFPSSGTLQPRILAGDGTIIYIDDCYVGPARNIGPISLVHTAVIAEGAACAGSPCTISRQSPNGWLSTVTRSAAGTYTANITAGIFSVAPTCNITVNQNSAKIGTVTTTSVPFTTTDDANTATDSQNIHISCSPTSQDAARIELQGLSWSGYHDNTCSWTRSNAAYGDPAGDASCGFVERVNAGFGTVTSAQSGGNNIPGIVFTPKKTGLYEFCAFPKTGLGGGSTYGDFRLTDGTTTLTEGEVISNSGWYNTLPACGLLNISSLASVTVKLQLKTDGTINIGNTGGPASTLEWVVKDVTQAFSLPQLVNSVFSGYAGQSRIEHAQLQNSNGATCPVTTGSSSWISGSRNAAGDCTWTFTGFSAAPTCTCSVVRPTGGQSFCTYNAQPTSTTLRILTLDGGTLTDRDIDLICIGPK